MKKNREEDPIGVIIQMYMQLSQGNSLWGNLYLKQAKMQFSFFFILQNWITGGQDRFGEVGGTSRRGRGRERG
jgi:hypothetical protein